MCFFQAGLLLTMCISFASTCVVQLPNGKLQGVVLDNYYSYTNIRYAEPPVRFEPSIPYEGKWDGIQNASGDIVSCVPFAKRTHTSDGQEDCLILNVFTPKTATDDDPLPVLIFIHGGAFMYGSSAKHSPKVIMAQGHMVVVSLNYRLGPFGFLSTGDAIIEGNFGLKDQLLALRWVRKNIHLFGGDPKKILLTGQSAGGASVHLQILRKEAKDLVSAAVSLSGTSLNPWVIQRNYRTRTVTLANLLNCPLLGGELKACLQDRSIEEINSAVLKMQTFLDNPFNVFGPIIESATIPDAFITEEPRILIDEGDIVDIPWMATFTTEEGAYNAASLLAKNDTGVEQIEELNDRWLELAPILLFFDGPSEQIKQELSQNLRDRYMGGQRFSRDTYPLVQKMFSDVLFINGIRETIRLHRIFGQYPVYSYIYGNPHNYGVGNFFAKNLEYRFGAANSDDLEHILPLDRNSDYTSGINDEKISSLMLQMLESFVLDGVPRFGATNVPANENNGQPMKYLQILEQEYCVGPWESYSYGKHECQACVCYDYST